MRVHWIIRDESSRLGTFWFFPKKCEAASDTSEWTITGRHGPIRGTAIGRPGARPAGATVGSRRKPYTLCMTCLDFPPCRGGCVAETVWPGRSGSCHLNRPGANLTGSW